MDQTSPRESIYDYSLYYDILFGWDRDAEATFYGRVLQECGIPLGSSILEVACGTGQVARRLARAGWRVTGLDNRPEMLRFLGDEAAADGHPVRTVCADMTRFGTNARHDAAYCPMASFCFLPDDPSALSHLRSVASALNAGGIYIVDLGLVPEHGDAEAGDEGWSMTRGRITVRDSGDTVIVDDAERGQNLVVGWGESAALRKYTALRFTQLVSESQVLTVEAWYPETGQDETGISMFAEAPQRDAPAAGRCMIVMRKARE